VRYKVLFEKRAAKELEELDSFTKKIIKAWIAKNLHNCENPRLLGKPLKGGDDSKWRYRIGDYRLLSTIDDGKVRIFVFRVRHRKDVYQNL
jgi:mRNA interferase RelE/StbE